MRGNAYAQLPNGKPLPDGWEYVGDPPDSSEGFSLRGITIFLGGNIIQPSPYYLDDAETNRACVVVSEDGGKTWDIRNVPFLKGEQIWRAWYGINPLSGTLYAIGREVDDSLWGFYISNDLGRSFSRYEFGYKLKFPEHHAPAFFTINPHDTNDIIVKYFWDYPGGFGTNNEIFRSIDGGKTWEEMHGLPMPIAGLGEYYELTLDVGTPGLWYASVIGVYHGGWPTNHRSTDNGYTWEEIFNFAEYAGIGGKGELRSKYSTYGFRGFRTNSAFGDSWQTDDWVKKALPNSGITNIDSGYTVNINTYIFDPNRPQTAFISITEGQNHSNIDSAFYSVYGFRTDSDGEIFELINADFDTTRVLGIFDFDPANYLVYGILGTKSYLVKRGVVTDPYYYLVRRKLQKSKVPLTNNVPGSIINAHPNPLDQKTTLTFENCTSGVMYMNVVNGLGVSVLREKIPDVDGLQQYAADLSGLPAGAYHIRLVCPADGWSASTSVIKTAAAVAPWSLNLKKMMGR